MRAGVFVYNKGMKNRTIGILVILTVFLFVAGRTNFFRNFITDETPFPELYRITIAQKTAGIGREVIMPKNDAIGVFDGFVKMRLLCSDDTIAKISLDRLAVSNDFVHIGEQSRMIEQASGISAVKPYEWSTIKTEDGCDKPVLTSVSARP